MTRDFSAARNPTGNTVPSVIGTSPNSSPGLALADHPLDAVHELGRFDPPLEHGEERALAALGRRVLARHEADVRGRSGEPLAVSRIESREDRDRADLLRCHHRINAPRSPCARTAARRGRPRSDRR